MPSLYDLKPRFQQALQPAAGALVEAGVSPNSISLAALALSGATGLGVCMAPASRWPLLAVGPILFIRMALNALDGMVARAADRETRAGAALNEAGDVLSDVALYAPFALLPGVEPGLVAAAVAFAVMTEVAGLAATWSGGTRAYDGPMGKSDRALAFGAMATVLGAGVPAGAWSALALLAISALELVTVANRARRIGARRTAV